MTGDGNSDTFAPKINQLAQDYIDELKKEQSRLPEDFPLCTELINDVIDRIYATGRTPGKELKADVFKQKPIKLSQNVFLPTREYPKFNFQGKLLGPKGNTLKRLHQETLCSISIRGRNSIRDQEREEELRQSGDPRYNHLNKHPYIEIATVAPPAEAYARIAYALTEIRKYIIPDKNDEISQEQYRELMEIDPELVKKNKASIRTQKSVFQKLASLGGAAKDDQEEETNSADNSHKDEGEFTENRFKRTEESPVAAKIKSIRTKPYQRRTPAKPVK